MVPAPPIDESTIRSWAQEIRRIAGTDSALSSKLLQAATHVDAEAILVANRSRLIPQLKGVAQTLRDTGQTALAQTIADALRDAQEAREHQDMPRDRDRQTRLLTRASAQALVYDVLDQLRMPYREDTAASGAELADLLNSAATGVAIVDDALSKARAALQLDDFQQAAVALQLVVSRWPWDIEDRPADR